MGWVKEKLTLESYLIDQEDYQKVVKQGTQRLEGVARACRDYMIEMRIADAVVDAAEIAAVVAGAEKREHPSDDSVSKGRIVVVVAAAVAGHAGDCKQDCTARNQPAIAEDLQRRLLGSEAALEKVGEPNSEGAAWLDWQQES